MHWNKHQHTFSGITSQLAVLCTVFFWYITWIDKLLFTCKLTQGRRGQLKAPKSGKCCCQIFEFYSSFSGLRVCRHRDYIGINLRCLNRPLFNENEFAVNYSFVNKPKKPSDCCQMSILQNYQNKMFSNENSETAIFCKIPLRISWYFFQISVIKIELSAGETGINVDKEVIQRWFFAITWRESILNYLIYYNLNMSPIHCEYLRQIAQIYYM